MNMERNREKYDRIIGLLRSSTPELKAPEILEKKIMMRLSKSRRRGLTFDSAFEILFSWVYIGWVRRSLIVCATLLVFAFIWQQGVIIKEVNFLNRQILETNDESSKYQSLLDGKKLIMFKGGSLLPSGRVKLSSGQTMDILKSYNELQSKYDQLLKLIEEDPDLKKLIDEKLEKTKTQKTKL